MIYMYIVRYKKYIEIVLIININYLMLFLGIVIGVVVMEGFYVVFDR